MDNALSAAYAGKKITTPQQLNPALATPAESALTNTGRLITVKSPTSTVREAVCANPSACFVAGTLIQTVDGLKPIEQIQRSDLVWSRQEFGDAYAYKPVFETKVTENQQIYEIVVENQTGETETYLTTSEHPFYIDGFGWLKASLLEAGMPLLDRNGNSGSLKVKSQTQLERWETVYNLEVEDYGTYHIGEFGVWVHNVCCNVVQGNAGGKHQWDRDLNAKTAKPNAKYEVNNSTHIHTYHTDNQGRVNKVEGQLTLNTMPRNTTQQASIGKSVNPTGDEGGHLIASALGGAGDRINLVPQSQRLNRSDWKKMENELARELKAGKSVSIKIDVGYPKGNSVRPNKFTVYANIDGQIKKFNFNQ